jgi:hypothetical protein
VTESDRPGWLFRIETLGTTLVVLMIGGLVLWFKAAERESRLGLVIGTALLIYAVGLVTLALRSNSATVAWRPFALAGLIAGLVSELINAQLLLTRESLAASLTGVAIGTAHWAALRTWLLLNEKGFPP